MFIAYPGLQARQSCCGGAWRPSWSPFLEPSSGRLEGGAKLLGATEARHPPVENSVAPLSATSGDRDSAWHMVELERGGPGSALETLMTFFKARGQWIGFAATPFSSARVAAAERKTSTRHCSWWQGRAAWGQK
eukprot:Skav217871  [mRNA]  locus=scaffold2487:101783:105134:+ [translate_table: standard]